MGGSVNEQTLQTLLLIVILAILIIGLVRGR
jgi:hypothetical protein